MDDKLKGIIQKGIRATALWLFSYILRIIANFEKILEEYLPVFCGIGQICGFDIVCSLYL